MSEIGMEIKKEEEKLKKQKGNPKVDNVIELIKQSGNGEDIKEGIRVIIDNRDRYFNLMNSNTETNLSNINEYLESIKIPTNSVDGYTFVSLWKLSLMTSLYGNQNALENDYEDDNPDFIYDETTLENVKNSIIRFSLILDVFYDKKDFKDNVKNMYHHYCKEYINNKTMLKQISEYLSSNLLEMEAEYNKMKTNFENEILNTKKENFIKLLKQCKTDKQRESVFKHFVSNFIYKNNPKELKIIIKKFKEEGHLKTADNLYKIAVGMTKIKKETDRLVDLLDSCNGNKDKQIKLFLEFTENKDIEELEKVENYLLFLGRVKTACNVKKIIDDRKQQFEEENRIIMNPKIKNEKLQNEEEDDIKQIIKELLRDDDNLQCKTMCNTLGYKFENSQLPQPSRLLLQPEEQLHLQKRQTEYQELSTDVKNLFTTSIVLFH